MTQPISPSTFSRRVDSANGDDPSPVPPSESPAVTDVARRALSYARADAHFTSAQANGDPICGGLRDERYDFERCATQARPLKTPVLYLQQANDREAVDSKDVRQGQAGDCAFMASLAALASTPEGRSVIRNAIAPNTDANGAVVSYTVTMHKPEPSRWPFGTKTFSEVRVTVEANPIPAYAEVRGTSDFLPTGGPQEVWPRVLERAYALVRGGYNATCHGDAPSTAMEVLTGKPATQTRMWFFGPSGAQIAGWVAAGKLVVLGTTKNAQGHHDLSNEHAYQVVGATIDKGKPSLLLHNPWNKGEGDPIVPYDELAKWFSSVNVGSVR